jgi:hypothetical protein
MTSIYQRALGRDFDRLHPKTQERFGFCSGDRVAHIGRGVMDEVSRGSALTVPFLTFGSTRNLLFPEQGTGIAFTVANYAYLDSYGRETITWNRAFDFRHKQRRFDAAMVYSDQRDLIVDYLGTHHHIAAELRCWVDDEGGMNFASGEQRCYEGFLGFRFPHPFTGHARVREWWDEEIELHRIRVDVKNPIVGKVLSYRGTFADETVAVPCQADIPDSMRPVREQLRD